MKNILYVNACIQRNIPSRTERLAEAYLQKRLEKEDCRLWKEVLETLSLYPLSGKALAAREEAIEKRDFSGNAFQLAREFAEADEVVIAAPYWDMSFPASLKVKII